MGSYLAVAFTLLLSMACHAQTVSLGQLTNTKWKLVSPVSDYCELSNVLGIEEER